MNTTPTIIVFDSGAGGLSVAKEILALRSCCHMVYVADNACFPYGLLDDQQLIARITEVMTQLIEQYTPDIVVIACNTASTLALDILRDTFPTLFVGVVPAIKPAAALSKTGVIGILATPATIERDYTNGLVTEFAANLTVIRLGSSILVQLAENYIQGKPVTDESLQQVLDLLKQQNHAEKMDTIVLACTHFPLLKDRLRQLPAYQRIRWIDSGYAVACRVEHLLTTLGWPLSCASEKSAELTFVFTSEVEGSTAKEAYRRFLES